MEPCSVGLLRDSYVTTCLNEAWRHSTFSGRRHHAWLTIFIAFFNTSNAYDIFSNISSLRYAFLCKYMHACLIYDWIICFVLVRLFISTVGLQRPLCIMFEPSFAWDRLLCRNLVLYRSLFNLVVVPNKPSSQPPWMSVLADHHRNINPGHKDRWYFFFKMLCFGIPPSLYLLPLHGIERVFFLYNVTVLRSEFGSVESLILPVIVYRYSLFSFALVS